MDTLKATSPAPALSHKLMLHIQDAAPEVPLASGCALSSLDKHSEQYRGIVLSIEHVCETTASWLQEHADTYSDVIDREYGFIVMLHDKLFHGELVPDDLIHILRQCHLAGYKQVMLADDGDVSDVLPLFSSVA